MKNKIKQKNNTMNIQKLQQKHDKLNLESKYNRRSIFKRAYYIAKQELISFSEALKQSWKEAKEFVFRIRIELDCVKRQMLESFTPQQKSNNNAFNYYMEYIVMKEKRTLSLD